MRKRRSSKYVKTRTLKLGSAQFRLLERLCNALAVSGDEGEIRQIVMEEIKPHADSIKVDALGNILVTKRGANGRRLRVLLDAHMDEVGFMIVAEDGDGIYRFEKVGGIDDQYLPGKQVIVGRNHIPGVIGFKPIHLASSAERSQKVAIESLRIDLGPGGKASIGDRAVFANSFKRVGSSIMAKSIDNRMGVAILIELIKHAPANIDLCAVFSVQEEIGARGAKVAAHAFNPHLAFVIESTPARDLPSQNGRDNTNYNTKLGLGPALYISDHNNLHDPRLIRFMQATAEAAGIPYQIRQPGGGGTNAGEIQQSLEGIPVLSVSVPHRYPHSPVSVARISDWKNTLNLLHTALKRISLSVIR